MKSRDISSFIKIRRSTPLDEIEIAQLIISSTELDTEHTFSNVGNRRENGETFVIELGYQIIGTITLVQPYTSLCESWVPGSPYLTGLAILSEFKGLGFSDVLIRKAHKCAVENGFGNICLHVLKDDILHEELFKSFGYREDSYGDQYRNGKLFKGLILNFVATGLRPFNTQSVLRLGLC